jgi:hypothetical protein
MSNHLASRAKDYERLIRLELIASELRGGNEKPIHLHTSRETKKIRTACTQLAESARRSYEHVPFLLRS